MKYNVAWHCHSQLGDCEYKLGTIAVDQWWLSIANKCRCRNSPINNTILHVAEASHNVVMVQVAKRFCCSSRYCLEQYTYSNSMQNGKQLEWNKSIMIWNVCQLSLSVSVAHILYMSYVTIIISLASLSGYFVTNAHKLAAVAVEVKNMSTECLYILSVQVWWDCLRRDDSETSLYGLMTTM